MGIEFSLFAALGRFGIDFDVSIRGQEIKDLADLISPNQVVLPKRPADIPHQQASTERMRRLLGWAPKHDLAQHMKELIRKKVRDHPGKYPVPGWLKDEGRSSLR